MESPEGRLNALNAKTEAVDSNRLDLYRTDGNRKDQPLIGSIRGNAP